MKKKLKKSLKKRLRKLVTKHGPEVAATLLTGFVSGVAASKKAGKHHRMEPLRHQAA